jgi:hypothetical protein
MKSFAMVLAAVGVFGGAVWASPITYTESGQLTGMLGGTTLTNANFTLVFNGDTANITGTTTLLNTAISNSFTIGGVNGLFTVPVEVGVSPSQGNIGFDAPALAAGITFPGGAFGYNLATPISVTALVPLFHTGSIPTSVGALVIGPAQNLSFTATLAPEPPSLTFLGVGLLALTGLCRKARRLLIH